VKCKIQNGTWLFVCDGQKALLLQNAGDAELVNLKAVEVFTEYHPSTHEIGTDKPGRSFQSRGHGRSANASPDLHAEAERNFVRRVVEFVNDAANKKSVTDLILIAPPKVLGLIRDDLAPEARALVRGEIGKDYAHLPISAIEEHLASE
jgi:protein required for attachment to host cells